MRRHVALVLIAGVALLGGPAQAAPAPSGGRTVPPPGPSDPGPVDRDGDGIGDDLAAQLSRAGAGDRVDVIVRGATATAARAAVGRFDVRRLLPLIGGFSARVTVGQARALARVPGVQRVDAVRTVRATDLATDRDFGALLARQTFSATGSGVGICVIDTGVDPVHEQLAPGPELFADFVNGRAGAYDDNGHGSHVASIALGDGTGGSAAGDRVGVAPEARLFAAKVLDSGGSGTSDQVIDGVQWCAAQPGVQVLSMSLGDPAANTTGDPLSNAVDVASASKVVVVAAGNSGDAPESVTPPGTAAGAITVGAVSDWSAPAGADYRDAGIALAPFSGRGPVPGQSYVKPDVLGPGVTVSAAQAGSVSGYATFSGTSMATPYVAGAVALALGVAGGGTTAQVRAALDATSRDRGAAGKDSDWGSGLVDVEAFVEDLRRRVQSVSGDNAETTAYPTFARLTGTVPNGGSTTVPVEVTSTSAPLAVTVTITSGEQSCLLFWPGAGCVWPGEWTPDLDVELRGPNGSVVATSECALSGWFCTAVGRQETVLVDQPVVGTYQLRVYAWNGGPGGTFAADISGGPVTGTAVPPPPGDTNSPPVANAGPDQTKKVWRRTGQATFKLDGTASSDPDGDLLTYSWTVSGVGFNATLSGAVVYVSVPAGTYTATLTVTDTHGAASTDQATLTART